MYLPLLYALLICFETILYFDASRKTIRTLHTSDLPGENTDRVAATAKVISPVSALLVVFPAKR